MLKRHTPLLPAVLLAAALCAAPPLSAQDPAEGNVAAPRSLPVEAVEMPVSIEELMYTLVEHSALEISAAAENLGDATDESWVEIEFQAVKLAAAGPLLMLGGSGEEDDSWAASPRWADYATAMSEAAAAVLAAARQMDADALRAAEMRIEESCIGCHESFGIEEEHESYYRYLRGARR